MRVIVVAGMGEHIPSTLVGMADVIVKGTRVVKERHAHGVRDLKQALAVAEEGVRIG